jgi:hypothetical protein
MRNLDSTSKYDIILCLFTSFGYFKNEKDDSLVLKKISQALKTRGSLFLDIPNSPRVIDYLMGGQVTANDFITRKTRVDKLSNGLVVTTQHEFDSKLIRWNMTRTWEEHKIEKSYRTSVRLYSFIEIKKLLLADGLKITRVWGDFSGSRYNSKSDRMIILAKKK